MLTPNLPYDYYIGESSSPFRGKDSFSSGGLTFLEWSKTGGPTGGAPTGDDGVNCRGPKGNEYAPSATDVDVVSLSSFYLCFREWKNWISYEVWKDYRYLSKAAIRIVVIKSNKMSCIWKHKTGMIVYKFDFYRPFKGRGGGKKKINKNFPFKNDVRDLYINK